MEMVIGFGVGSIVLRLETLELSGKRDWFWGSSAYKSVGARSVREDRRVIKAIHRAGSIVLRVEMLS